MKKLFILVIVIFMAYLILAAEGISSNNFRNSTRAIPQSMNFQGELKTSAGEPVNDTKDITFLIYLVENSGTALWTELQSSIEIIDGLFSAELGDDTPFPGDLWDNTNLYITFSIDGEEMSPRQKIMAVPYALQSSTLDGVPLSGVVQQDDSGNAAISGTMTADSFEGDRVYVDQAETDGIKVFKAGSTSTYHVSYLNNGLEICGAHGNGVYVGYANEDALSVYQAGSPSYFYNSTLSNGLEICGAEGNGVFVGQADADGLSVMHAGDPSRLSWSDLSNGLEIWGAEGHGVYVGGADEDGIFINIAKKGLMIDKGINNGIDIHEVGSPIDTWESSSYNGIEIDGAEGNGLCVGYAHNGTYVRQATEDGLHVHSAGSPSSTHESDNSNGLEVAGAEGNGVYVGQADEDGIKVYRAGNVSSTYDSSSKNGLEICGTEGNGVYVGHAERYGLYVYQTNSAGVNVYQAGNPSGIYGSSLNHGFSVNGAEGHGVYIGRADVNGVYVHSAAKGMTIGSVDNTGIDVKEVGTPVDTWESSAYNGIEIDGAQGNGFCAGYVHNGAYIYEAAADGIYVRQADDDGFVAYAGDDAVYAQTYDTSNEWGFYSPDKIHGSNVTTRSMSVHVLNTGNESLAPGDVVSIAGGYSTKVLGDDDDEPLINVVRSTSENAQAVFGVVEYKVAVREEVTTLEGEEPRVEKSFRYEPGSAAEGEYLSVIVYGPADVNVAGSDIIESGESLAAGDGFVRKVKTTEINGITIAENTGIVGKALESARGGKMKIFVTCR